MYQQYEMTQRQNSRFQAPLIRDEPVQIIVPNYLRTCTDWVCTILMILTIGAVIGIFIYGLVDGDPKSVISLHNADKVRCNTIDNFKFGYLVNWGTFENAVCVRACPSAANQAMECLPDGQNCPTTGVLTSTYGTFALESYCIINNEENSINLNSLFNFDAFEQWIYDVQEGWAVLLVSAFGAMVLSLIFFVFVRCCAGPIIWIFITLFLLCMLTLGIFFILEAKGVVIDDYITNTLSSFSYDTLIIAGSILIGLSVLFTILVCCMRSRISTGAKAVELGSIFLLENCCLVILPITQALIVLAAFGVLLVGAVALYSTGTFTFPNFAAIPTVGLQDWQVFLVFLFIALALWMIFFFQGCNHFMLCSAVSIWYFNNANGEGGSPCCDSLLRLVRYHPGSVAFTSFLNGFLFLIKLLANILSFDSRDDDSALVSCCLKCLNCLLCIFKCFLRFLNDGTYVQIAINGSNYCTSTYKAFDILAENITKIGITEGISMFFTIMGVLGITVIVGFCSYFAVLYLPYYKERINSAFVTTFVSAAIAFVISCIYLSMIDVSSTSVLQCYLVDNERNNGIRYANERVKELMTVD